MADLYPCPGHTHYLEHGSRLQVVATQWVQVAVQALFKVPLGCRYTPKCT